MKGRETGFPRIRLRLCRPLEDWPLGAWKSEPPGESCGYLQAEFAHVSCILVAEAVFGTDEAVDVRLVQRFRTKK